MNWLRLKKELSQPLEDKIEFLVKMYLVSSSISFYLFADCIEGSLWKVTYCEALCSARLLQAVVYFYQMEISLTREIQLLIDQILHCVGYSFQKLLILRWLVTREEVLVFAGGFLMLLSVLLQVGISPWLTRLQLKLMLELPSCFLK